MEIRKARIDETDEILSIYDRARKYMAEKDNPNQWIKGYPQRGLVLEDINLGNLYVYVIDGEIEAVFLFALGVEPTYRVIEGAWLNEDEYGYMHRIASRGRQKGLLKHIVDYCYGIHGNLRIDTHRDNKIMQHLLTKYGFEECGIIYLEDGSPRIAYQKIK